MKIKVIDKEDNFKFTFHFPLFFIKIGFKRIDEFKDKNIDVDELYKKLKKFKKEYGHFVLVEVKAADGSYVKITI